MRAVLARASTPRAISCACVVALAPVCAVRGLRSGSSADVLAGVAGVPLGILGFAYAILRPEA